MIQAGICDDEPGAASMIASSFANMLRTRGEAAQTTEYYSAQQLLFAMEDQHFDVLLLDIDMPDMSGLELGERLRQKKQAQDTELIYVSGREDKVFDSLKLAPVAFIRKAHFLEDIPTAVDLFLQKRKKSRQVLTIQENQTYAAIPLDDILYIEGEHNYQNVHYMQENQLRQIRIRKSMQELETTLAPYDFIRIHKGYLVNSAWISLIADDVVLRNNEHLPMSRRSVTRIRTAYMNYIEKNAGPLI